MSTATRFEGVMTALVTPFRNGQVDEAALRALVAEQLEAGIDGLVPCGTTGEAPTLSMAEHVRVVEIVVDEASGRVPVLAGAGSNSTAHAIELAAQVRDAGAQGMLQITPYYSRPTPEGLLRHFTTILEAVALPTVVYNVPTRTGCDLKPETVARLAELPGIVGIKEATGDINRTQQIVRRSGGRLAVLSGDDFTALALYAVGARGVISVLSNVRPREMVAIWHAFREGDLGQARALHYRLLPLCEALFAETNPIPVKAALHMLGKIGDQLRLPLTPLSAEPRQRLAEALAALGEPLQGVSKVRS